MAQDMLTLADLVTLNSAGIADIEVSDILDAAPVLRALAGDFASHGTKHEYLKETGAPVVGFRAVNTGRDYDSSVDELVTINLAILDATFAVDKALADAYQRGGAEAYLAKEARRHLRAGFFGIEKQFFQGTGLDSNGFSGFCDSTGLDKLNDAMVIGAGGTGGGSVYTSVYAIRSTPDQSNAVVIMGQNGEIGIGETQVVPIPELSGGNPLSKTYPGYYTPITGWVGLQLGSAYSVARLANLDAGSKTLDDDLLSNLLELFPSAAPPTMLVMHRQSRFQLQRSRTTFSPTGVAAPLPTEYEGIPIITTDAVSITEAEVAAS
jgi:hypothetical protein